MFTLTMRVALTTHVNGMMMIKIFSILIILVIGNFYALIPQSERIAVFFFVALFWQTMLMSRRASFVYCLNIIIFLN